MWKKTNQGLLKQVNAGTLAMREAIQTRYLDVLGRMAIDDEAFAESLNNRLSEPRLATISPTLTVTCGNSGSDIT